MKIETELEQMKSAIDISEAKARERSGTNMVKLSATNSGVLADTTFVDTGTTGVTATIGVTTAGSSNVWVDATGSTV